MRNKPGKLIKTLTFKVIGEGRTIEGKVGKKVRVDKSALEAGWYVVFYDRKSVAKVAGEHLHEYVEF